MTRESSLTGAQRRTLLAVRAGTVAWLPNQRAYRGARSDVVDRLLKAGLIEFVWRGTSAEARAAITDAGREALNARS